MFRRWLDANPALLNSIKQFAQFRVVVDANIVIQDLIHRVKFPERGNTALQELVQSTVIEAHVPRWLETEMASAIPQAAERQSLSEEKLWNCWQEYKYLLKWDDTLAEVSPTGLSVVDPKDLPYVLLEKAVGAVGVLSHDRHLQKMGANRLTFDFVLTVRAYARASVVDVGIRVSGIMLGTVALGVFRSLISALRAMMERLPPAWKLVLAIAGFIAVLHPATRAWISDRLRSIAPAIAALWNETLPGIMELSETAKAKRGEADANLSQALRFVPVSQ